MKILNLKTILIIIFLSLIITSCTDLNDEDDLLLNNTEITTNNDINTDTGEGNGEDGSGKDD